MKKQITIVHLTSSLKMGGAEAVLCDIVHRLNQEQFNHYVVYFHEGPNLERLTAMGIKTYYVKGLFFRYDPVFFIRLLWLVAHLKPDCIHSLLWAANVSGRFIAKILRIPSVSVLHNNVDQDGVIRNALDRITILFADTIVAVSTGVAQSLRNRDKWIPARRIQVIRNGVDIAAIRTKGIQYQKNRYELGLSEEHFVIGSVGRFHPVKNYSLLLESFALVNTSNPLTRLVLVGMGSQEEMLRKQAIQLGIEQNVVFIIGQQAYGYYPLFDCFALSSDKEGISIALLEALSFGLPCVVTNSEIDHAVIKSGENGMVVPARNTRALADVLSRLVHDEKLRERLGLAAKQTVAHFFSVEQMVQAYKTVFLNVSSS